VEDWLARRQRSGRLAAQTASTTPSTCGSSAGGSRPPAGPPATRSADRRHLRRAITPAELGAVLASTAASRVRRCKMAGRQRCLLYAVALGTGLRRNELSSLAPESFDLAADPPTVSVGGAFTKDRRQALLPLRRDLAAQLRDWLRGRRPGEVLFPIRDSRSTP
jgi:integrase